jgi:3-oxoacyl-[acyl-carrier protein] reductase
MINDITRKLGPITHLINCATYPTPNIKFLNLDWKNFENHFNLNIKASFNLIHLLVPQMKINNYGNFIFFSSMYTDSPKSELSYYITSKSAIEGFTRSLAVEFGPNNIRFNLVSPGMTYTDLLSDVPEKSLLLSAMNTPLRRIANVKDISSAVTFLASDESSYITGETIRINGGQINI